MGQHSSPVTVWRRTDNADTILYGHKAVELHKSLLLETDMANRRKLDDQDLFVSSLQLAEQLIQQIHVFHERGSLATGGMISARERYSKTSDLLRSVSADNNSLKKEVSDLTSYLESSKKREDEKAALVDRQ